MKKDIFPKDTSAELAEVLFEDLQAIRPGTKLDHPLPRLVPPDKLKSNIAHLTTSSVVSAFHRRIVENHTEPSG